MLTESFVASTQSLEKKANATTAKDVGIHLNEYQPNPTLRSSFKKSSTQPNCLAVNATHVFAAQADKSVIHVYSRERHNQEAIVPLQEQITCLALAGRYHGAGTLVMGTQGGRLILWEVGHVCHLELAQLNSPSSLQLAVRSAHLRPISSP